LVKILFSCLLFAAATVGLLSCTRHSNVSPAAITSGSPAVKNSAVDLSTQTPGSEPKRIFNSGEAVPAGYLGFKVLGSWFTDHLPQESGKTTNYLCVDLAIINTDKRERPRSPLALIDETGKEYPLSEKAAAVERSVAKLGMLTPNQSQHAIAIFAVPKGHEYKLKIQGFSAADIVQIKLSPAPTAPQQ
jgi:Domain of unknown function (DUF4352)